jgi:hypothetical protein
MPLVPSQKQWQSWSLPSKLTVIGFVIALIPFALAAVVFVVSRFAPDFVTEYKDMDVVPLSAIQKSFGLLKNPIGNDTQTRLLRIAVRNNKSSSGAQDVKIVVADYVHTLAFVMEENGDAIEKYTLTPSGNSSRLEVPIGYLPPRSEHVVFVGGRCLFIDFADIHAESSNLGISDTNQIGELSGIRLFMGTYAEWISIAFLIALGMAFLAATKKRTR